MTTIGDSFLIVAILLGVGVTSWALMVCCALLLPSRVAKAKEAADKGIWANLGTGLLTLLPGLLGLPLLGSPLPGTKILGMTLILGVLGVGAIGAAGMGMIAARQIQKMAPELGDYPAFLRGSAFLVTGSMLPILGWLGFGPVIILASLGCGVKAIARKRVPPIYASPV